MGGHAKGIYVQIDVRGSIEELWRLTQTPELHQRWDLRFTQIEYLPRTNQDEPQRFVYTTRIGMGLAIRGQGETVGNHDGPAGQSTSALKFWSDDPKSLIRKGSGYWKYTPRDQPEQTVRFLTGYDYDVRFGAMGRLFDRAIFRPMLGWATAWSFDRLRLWVEQQIDPVESMRRSLIYFVARLTVALVWLYQGSVPKLIFQHPDELKMLGRMGVSASAVRDMCAVIGWAEVVFGLIVLLAWRSRWPLWVTLIAMPVATVAVAASSPTFLSAAFNPVALNICVFALAMIALLEHRNLPTASRCMRRPTAGEP